MLYNANPQSRLIQTKVARTHAKMCTSLTEPSRLGQHRPAVKHWSVRGKAAATSLVATGNQLVWPIDVDPNVAFVILFIPFCDGVIGVDFESEPMKSGAIQVEESGSG